MPKLPDYIINNFNGGLVGDKSDLVMDRNEFKRTINLDFDEIGRAKRRLGIRQIGSTANATVDNSFIFNRNSSGTFVAHHLVITRSATPTVYNLVGSYLTADILTTTTTINIGNNGNFDASGTVEIEGDLVTYSGTNGTTQLTGCSGIRVSHKAFAPVRQLVALGTPSVDTRAGAYFAVLNNLCIINGATGGVTFDGSSFSNIIDADEGNGLFDTVYRSRIYRIGVGTGTNGSPIRVSYSDAGDATSWDANNYFDVEDQRGEFGTSLKELNDYLLIFKPSSIFTYDEVQLKQRLYNVGAFNDRVIQKINKTLFTFCPSGIYATNGFSAELISKPIEKYLHNFHPRYDTTYNRVVNNTCAGQQDDKYYLYIGSIEDPDDEAQTLDDVCLVYDTIRKNWTVHTEYTHFTHFGSFNNFIRGTTENSTVGGPTTQFDKALFAGGDDIYYRLFEDHFLDNEATRTHRGGKLYPNMQANDAGLPISTDIETRFIDLGNPLIKKKVGSLAAIVEQGDFTISYRIDLGTHKTEWKPLGIFKTGISEKKLPIPEGYRFAIKASNNSLNAQDILNALILRNIESTEKIEYAE